MNQMQQLQAMMRQRQNAPAPLVEFKAGLLKQSGSTISADPRRGRIKLLRTPDGLLHWQWSKRPNGVVEPAHEVVLYPGSASWIHIEECKDGRVYCLKRGAMKRFYWMQDEKEEKDEEVNKIVRDALQSPNTLSSSSSSAATATSTSSSSSSATPSTTTTTAPATSTSTTDANANAMALFQQYARQLQAQQQLQGISLTSVLAPTRVAPLLDEEAIQSLLEYLPESQRTEEHFRRTLRSPQLRQCMDRLGSVLNSEQYGHVMTSMGLEMQSSMGVEGYLEAIEAQVASEQQQQQQASTDDPMDIVEDDDDDGDNEPQTPQNN